MTPFTCVLAVLTLADPFRPGAVLQRDRRIPIWGRADAGASVSVTFAGQAKTALAGGDGAWRVDLDPLGLSTRGQTLTVRAGTACVRLDDVLVGDVWIVSGQSNMDCPIVGPDPRYRDGQGLAMARVTNLPLVRWQNRGGGWKKLVCENTAQPRAISAVAFYFAREVFHATGVPLGLLCAYCGGTNIEEWTPKSGYAALGEFPEILNWKRIPESEFGKQHHRGAINHPSKQPFMAFEDRFAPRAPYGAKGMIWYQGEQNARTDEKVYDRKLEALLKGFEIEFENPDLKFYFVQIPYPCSSEAFMITQARFAAAHERDGRVKMVVVTDVANTLDVHPAEKEPVGRRLAHLALRYDYGFDALEAESPVPVSAAASSNRVTVAFAHAKTLCVYNEKLSYDTTFELAGADGAFKPAKIVNRHAWVAYGRNYVHGELEGPVAVLEAEGVSEPREVRYLHVPPRKSNIFNESGLPLGAFRMPCTAK